MGWTQGNLIFKEREKRREGKREKRFFTIKLRVKKWRGVKNGEDHEMRLKKDENKNRME